MIRRSGGVGTTRSGGKRAGRSPNDFHHGLLGATIAALAVAGRQVALVASGRGHRGPVETTWQLSAIASVVGLVALGWMMGGLVGRVLDVRRHRLHRAPIGHRLRRATALNMALLIIVMSALTTRSMDTVLDDARYRTDDASPNVPVLSVTEFRSQASGPDGDRRLANWLLDALAPLEQELRSRQPAQADRPLLLASTIDSDWQRHVVYDVWGERFPLVSHRAILPDPPAPGEADVFTTSQWRPTYNGTPSARSSSAPR